MRRERDYQGYGKEYNVKTGKGEAIPSFYIKPVGKNIKWGRGEGDMKIWGRKSSFRKIGLGKNIKL